MPEPQTPRDQPLHVDAKQDAERLVVLTPDDEDRFVRSCKWVVEASKLGISVDVWLRELHALLSHVSRWSEQHAAQVKACMAMQRDDQIAIFVIPTAAQYDFELSDLLTELDLELAEKFQACRCDVLQMPTKPFEELEDLSGNKSAVLIYGHPSPA